VTFRDALDSDALAIAHLHAESWRSAYRGMLSDDYLDNRAHPERAALWPTRFAEKEQKPFFAILAESDKQLVGFACVFPNDHPIFGSFLDNLHVLPHLVGQGIGRQLLTEVARRLAADRIAGGLYLWVIEQNIRARRFYKSAGGIEVERAILSMPDGASLAETRCHWPNPASLLL
jgi:hypothetical protein